MADFEMRNFDHFPVEKSSYDLKLELLEELDPKEALELMKTNKEFRSIYLKDSWRIFGRHVHLINFMSSNEIEIWKFRGKTSLAFDPQFHLPLLKKVKSCVIFDYSRYGQSQQAIDTARKTLSNLDSIEKWWSPIIDLEGFNECFLNFKGQITYYIWMNLAWYSGEQNDPTHSVISKVFETQLGMCDQVCVVCSFDQFSMIFKLFSKTKIKYIIWNFDKTKSFSATDFKMLIRWIVCDGVPSQNREARISISLYKRMPDSAYDSLANFLSTFPGMQRLPENGYQRRIDDERDCIYELKNARFGAKYVPSRAQ